MTRGARAFAMLLSVVLIVSTLGVNAGEAFAAPGQHPSDPSPKNHQLYSVDYQKAYANPDANKEEAALLWSLVILHPTLQKFKRLRDALIYLGLWQGLSAVFLREKNAKESQGYYLIEKRVYKSKKPTSSYWGYSQTYVYSSRLKEKVKGKTLPIGKTSY